MMAWFVTMCILSDQSGHIGLCSFQFHCKYRVKFVEERFFSSKQCNQTRYIVLNMPGILPCISFGIVSTYTFRVSYLTWVERALPCTVSFFRAHEFCRRIEQILVVICTFCKVSSIFFFPHTFCHIGSCIIIVYTFQS